jgi:MFS family permease
MKHTANSSLLALAVSGGVIMGLALGVRHVQGLFLLPVTLSHGWPRDTFAFAIALQNLTWGLTQPLVGMVADRYGSARVIAAGLVCGVLGLVLMALASTPAVFTVGAGFFFGLGLSGTAFGAVYGALSRLVAEEQRAWALGVAGAIGGLGQFILVPLAQELIVTYGWSAALAILAAALACVLPLAQRLRDAPSGLEAGAPQGLRQAIVEACSQRAFWLLNLGFLACGFQLAFIANHLPAYLLDRGLPAKSAVTALALVALANVAGTYACGVLGGRFRRKYLLAWIYLLRSAAMAAFMLAPLSVWSAYAFAIVMGLLWLGTVPLTNGLVSQLFGVRYLTTLFGFVFLGHQLGAFLGSWLGGLVFESTGSYNLVWFLSMGLGVMAAALHIPIHDQTRRRLVPVSA